MRVLDFNDTQSSNTTPSPLNGRLVTGSLGSPELITAVGGISISTSNADEAIFCEGSGGAVDITANPQIANGGFEGQILTLICTSDTNTITLNSGDGLFLGDGTNTITLYNNETIQFIWSGALWLIL